MRGDLALVANAGELVPGRIGPRRRIDPADGRLDLLVLGGGNPITGLHGAARLMLGTREEHDGVIRRGVQAVRIEAEPVAADRDRRRSPSAGLARVRVLPRPPVPSPS